MSKSGPLAQFGVDFDSTEHWAFGFSSPARSDADLVDVAELSRPASMVHGSAVDHVEEN